MWMRTLLECNSTCAHIVPAGRSSRGHYWPAGRMYSSCRRNVCRRNATTPAGALKRDLDKQDLTPLPNWRDYFGKMGEGQQPCGHLAKLSLLLRGRRSCLQKHYAWMVSLKVNVVILLYDVQSPKMRSEDETWGRWWCHPGTQPADTRYKVVNDIREIIQRVHCRPTKLCR